jgi:ATP-dependent Clp protease ATP-binding subunit ClpA
VYPFERFTEATKRVLTLAQQEAERAHHSYIGTEHLLLGLLIEGEGIGAPRSRRCRALEAVRGGCAPSPRNRRPYGVPL